MKANPFDGGKHIKAEVGPTRVVGLRASTGSIITCRVYGCWLRFEASLRLFSRVTGSSLFSVQVRPRGKKMLMVLHGEGIYIHIYT